MCEGEGLRRNGEVTGIRGKWRIAALRVNRAGRGEEKGQLFCVIKVAAGAKIKVHRTGVKPEDCGAEEKTGGRAGGARGEDIIPEEE